MSKSTAIYNEKQNQTIFLHLNETNPVVQPNQQIFLVSLCQNQSTKLSITWYQLNLAGNATNVSLDFFFFS